MTTLYRKYRPQNFNQIVGQEVVVKTLQNALILNVPAHSYLFTGPRGTGKTSLARIFACALNCQNRDGAQACGQCAHCLALKESQSLDVLEIDAASYTGVDNIRSLRETMSNTPMVGKYKIYIIDEVHMLSIGAFNALLKIMEEPPSHVIFLLATTELQKVPKTILSRCQRFDLRKFTLTEIIGKLETIIQKEKIKAEKEALVLIAKNSGGALRDAESLLAQLTTLTQEKLTANFVQTTLGVSDTHTLFLLIHFFVKGNLEALLILVKNIEDSGKNPAPFTAEFINLVRSLILFKAQKKFDIDPLTLFTKEEQGEITLLSQSLSYEVLSGLIEALETALQKIKMGSPGFLPLEIAFIKNLAIREQANESDAPKSPTSVDPPLKIFKNKDSKDVEKEASEEYSSTLSSSVSLKKIEAEWTAIIEKIKFLNASLSVALQNARPVSLQENCLHIAVKYKFHQERLNEKPNQLTLAKAFDTILGTHLAFSIKEEPMPLPEQKQKNADPMVQHALELLGGSVI